MARCSVHARYTYIGLFTECDDTGRGVADARVLKGRLWPQDDDVDPKKVEECLDELSLTGHIVLYVVEDKKYYAILSFEKHQSAEYRRGKPKWPEPPFSVDSKIPGQKGDAKSCKDLLEGTGREEKRRDIEDAGVERTGIDARNPKKQEKGKSTTPVPEDFQLTPERKEWAVQHGYDDLDLDFEVVQFIDNHAAKGNRFVDWERAWHTWLRNAKKWSKPKPGQMSTGPVNHSRRSQAEADVRMYRQLGEDNEADEMQAQIDAGEHD